MAIKKKVSKLKDNHARKQSRQEIDEVLVFTGTGAGLLTVLRVLALAGFGWNEDRLFSTLRPTKRSCSNMETL